MRPFILLALFQLVFFFASAGRISGLVTDEKGEPLPYASVSVKGSQNGAIANAKGYFEISLSPGTYTIVCQHVGYKAESKSVELQNEAVVNFQLFTQQLNMAEVVVKNGPDPAIEIIRQTIKKREQYGREVDSFSVDVYIKGQLKTRHVPKKFIKDEGKEEMEKTGFDSLGRGILFLSESMTKVSYKKPDVYKYEVISSRQAGGGYGISFPFFISFYKSNVQVFNGLNPRGFVSPISDNAFHFYKFHYEGSFFENDRQIDRIKVTPKRKNEPLFQGYLQIVDGEWRIHSLDLFTTKDYQLQLIDTVRLTQIHAPVTTDAWRVQNQVVYLAAKTFGVEWTGNFLNVYNNYDLDPGFGKKHFTRTIMKYDSAFNKKDSLYWSNVRPIPLEADEQRDFKIKDSFYKRLRDSLFTEAGADSMNKRQRPITFSQAFLTGIVRRKHTTHGMFSYQLSPLLYSLTYNTVEGFAPNFVHSFNYYPKKGRYNYKFDVTTRYGFSNEHFNPSASFALASKRQPTAQYFEIGGGKRVSQFNRANPIDPLINTTYTLYRKRNYMKIYEAWFGEVKYNGRMENGLAWRVSASYEDRLPLKNTTDYAMAKRYREFLPNHPYELANIPFEKHQALVAGLSLSFQPGQRFIEYPFGKVSIGSKYPVIQAYYAKGIRSLAGSDVDFDKWKLTVSDNVNLKLGGEFRYRIAAGGFFNSANVPIPDMHHFNGNQTFAAGDYLNTFQLAPYYRYSNTEPIFGELHAEHHFNGLITNKIPLFNKLKWNLVGGANMFYVNSNNYYVEGLVGLENILKIFRVDFVAGYQAQPGNNFGVRVGAGGILGGALAARKN